MTRSKVVQPMSAAEKLKASQDEIKNKPAVEAKVEVVLDDVPFEVGEWTDKSASGLLGAYLYDSDGPVIDVLADSEVIHRTSEGEEMVEDARRVSIVAPALGAPWPSRNKPFSLLGWRIRVKGRKGVWTVFRWDGLLHHLATSDLADGTLKAVDLAREPYYVVGPSFISIRENQEFVQAECTNLANIRNLYAQTTDSNAPMLVVAQRRLGTVVFFKNPVGGEIDVFAPDLRYLPRLRTYEETKADIQLAKTRHPLFMMGLHVQVKSDETKHVGFVEAYCPRTKAYALATEGTLIWLPANLTWETYYNLHLGHCVRVTLTVPGRGSFDVRTTHDSTIGAIKRLAQDRTGAATSKMSIYRSGRSPSASDESDSDDEVPITARLSDDTRVRNVYNPLQVQDNHHFKFDLVIEA